MAEEKSLDEMISTEEEIEVTYKFTKSEDHRSFMTNRIWGGIQAGGLFEISFMLEHKPIPTITTEKISRSGTKEIDREQERAAIQLYKQIIDVADKARDDEIKSLFQRILAEEVKHHQLFSDLLED